MKDVATPEFYLSSCRPCSLVGRRYLDSISRRGNRFSLRPRREPSCRLFDKRRSRFVHRRSRSLFRLSLRWPCGAIKGFARAGQELANLMNRASEGGGGVLIGNLAYRTDYENVVGEEKVLRRAAAEKNANYPCQPSLSRPLQPRTRRSLRQLPHRSFKAIRPSADQPS
jgi:hypothetical protein